MSDMTNNETSFQESLKKAQELGFAESDPAFDIEGIDSGHKLVILGMLAYGVKPDLDKVFIEGITSITSEDIKYATRLGFVIKLFCIARKEKNKLDFRVHPSLIPLNALPASINGALNAVFIQGDYSEKITFIGEGAGANPTASSVVSDIINAARNHKLKNNLSFLNQKLEYKDIIDRVGRYYIRFVVQDVAGVLANITTILNNKHISLDSVVQDRNKGEDFNNIKPDLIEIDVGIVSQFNYKAIVENESIPSCGFIDKDYLYEDDNVLDKDLLFLIDTYHNDLYDENHLNATVRVAAFNTLFCMKDNELYGSIIILVNLELSNNPSSKSNSHALFCFAKSCLCSLFASFVIRS